ncbi:efflux RND transporter periplasmic adaptor subunit [Aurantivibrio infirmus]
MNKPIVITLCIAALLAVLLIIKESGSQQGQGGMRRGPGAAAVEVYKVEPQALSVSTEALGTAYARESVEITPNVSDTIQSINFQDGQSVKAGDILLVLNHSEEDAELKSAQANLAEQEREVKRLQDLRKSQSVSQSLLDERLTAKETAEYRLAAVEARLKDRFITAPFNGVLGLRNVSPGSLVSPGVVITTLDDVETMKLDFAVPAIYLSSLATGISVKARSPALADRFFTGNIVSIDSRINQIDRSIKVRAELPNTDRTIKPGMLMHIEILLDDREALVIPETALVPQRDKHFVYLVSSDTPPVAKIQEVEIGIRQPGIVEIVSGLSAGDTVVTRGANNLSENNPLNIIRHSNDDG